MAVPFKVDLSGKVAVVTGGGGVLCGAMAKALAECGAAVAVADLKLEAAQRVADEITAAGGKAMAVACNDAVAIARGSPGAPALSTIGSRGSHGPLPGSAWAGLEGATSSVAATVNPRTAERRVMLDNRRRAPERPDSGVRGRSGTWLRATEGISSSTPS